jgi:hypothetical protein
MQIKTKRNYIILVIFFSFCFIFFAESQNVEISGRILEYSTNKPLSYASIFSTLRGKSTVSDQNGNFKLKINNLNDTLIISYLGYSELFLPIKSLPSFSDNKFYLIQKDYSISEITVNPTYPTDIIELALSKIPDNYPCKEMYFTSYFFENVTENDTVIQEVEAIMEILKSPYNISSKDRIKFTHGKINQNVKESKLWDYIFFINGPYELLYSDIVKNPDDFLQVPDNQIHFLNKDHFKHYKYLFKDTIDESIIKIIFYPNPETQRGVYKGEILIDRISYAFISFEFEYAEERLEKVYYSESTMELQFRQMGIFIPDNKYRCRVEYVKNNDYWILNKVINEYGFVFQTSAEKFSQINIVDKLFISKISLETQKIDFFHQVIKDVNILQIIPKTDSTVWNSLNIDFK